MVERTGLAIVQFFSHPLFQFRIEFDLFADRCLRDAQDGLAQVFGCAFHGAAFMEQPLDAHIKVEAALAMRAGRQVLLHNRDFIGAQLVIYIEMQTSNRFKTIHTLFHRLSIAPGAQYCSQENCANVQTIE